MIKWKRTITIIYKSKFIGSIRFMASSSDLVENISKIIHKIKCKHGHENKFFFKKCKIEYKN